MRVGITTEERRELRRKAFWRISDFARYMGMSHWQAKATLQRYDEALGGMLLRKSRGSNRLFGFYWAALAKHDGDAFVDDPLETQSRVDALEDEVEELAQKTKILGAQTGANTRQIARLGSRRRSAA